MCRKDQKDSQSNGKLTFVCFVGLLLGSIAMGSAFAQNLDDCIEEAYGGTLNCTANDVQLSLLTVNDPNSQCVESPIGSGEFYATVKMQAELVATAQERYDIGLWIASDGGSARTGTCARNYLPGLPYADLANPGNKGATGLGNGPGPYFDAENAVDPTDQCGDLPQNVHFFYGLREIDPLTGLVVAGIHPANTQLGDYVNITIKCVDSNGNGTVDVNTCTSWDNKKTNRCSDLFDALPNNKAKCNCQNIETNLRQPGFLTVEKICVPSGDGGLFDLKVDSDTWLADAQCGDSIKQSVPAGSTVTVSEAAGSGTDLADYETPVIGGDCAADGTVSIASGDDKTCTITNTLIICPADLACDSDLCGYYTCDPNGAPSNCDVPHFESADTECRASAGVCDLGESCTGSSIECPADGANLTTECNPSAGVCDLAEFCSDASDECPADGPNLTTECNAATGVCDQAEFCSDASDECPADGPNLTTECNPSAGVCDQAEFCSDASDECPADGPNLTTECRPSTGVCDPSEICSDASDDCPADISNICAAAEGCSPGYWKNHRSQWDGIAPDATTSVTIHTTWASLNVSSCDHVNLSGKTLGNTIACPNSKCGSSNKLFQLSACLASDDALNGFPDFGNLKAAIASACANGGQELKDLAASCAAANSDNGTTIMCPLN